MTRKKILLVDDSPTSLFVERMVLKDSNYELVTARDGQEAVEQADLHRPDLILMDVIMPRKTGLEACRELRRRPTTERTPIILVTTRGESDSVEAGYESGCNDYITKPIDGLELLTKVRSHLGD
jgi:DNA-binding response OmpR family regulator